MNTEILKILDISPNDSFLYSKALQIIDFMSNIYSGEDIRFVSAYLFGDSKIIDKNKKLRNLFNHFAYVDRPNIIYIRTDTDLAINSVSIKALTEKLHLCAFFGGDIQELAQTSCDVVISENLSFFMSAKPSNAIFLYSKGFHLIDSISIFVKKLKYNNLIHFGDVDFEGIAIFEAFKERLQDIVFYPHINTVKTIIDKYGDILPKNNQDFNKYSYKTTEELVKLVKDGSGIEQEFVHSLIVKGLIERPRWMK